jgi:hypothetical protein
LKSLSSSQNNDKRMTMKGFIDNLVQMAQENADDGNGTNLDLVQLFGADYLKGVYTDIRDKEITLASGGSEEPTSPSVASVKSVEPAYTVVGGGRLMAISDHCSFPPPRHRRLAGPTVA